MGRLFVIAFACFVINLGFSQTRYVNEFLNIGVGARALGMSGSVVSSVKDGTAAYWNPANLSQLTKPLELNAMHASWFGGISNYDFISLAKRLGEGDTYLSLSMIRMGVDNIPNTLNLIGPDESFNFDKITTFSASDYGFLLSLGSKRSEKFSLGGSVKLIHRTIGDFGSSWGFGADLSASYQLGSLRIGSIFRDITTTFNSWTFNLNEQEKKAFLATGNDVPITSTEITLPRMILGASYNFNVGLMSILPELNLHLSTDGRASGLISSKSLSIEPTAGVEVGYSDKVYVRGGIGNIQRVINLNSDNKVLDFQPNVGLGLVLGRLKIDYALANVGNFGGVASSQIFSLSLLFKERNE
jgi:hypothetical protein